MRLCALRRAGWQSLRAHGDAGRADLSATLTLAQDHGRILLNPFATATAVAADPFTVDDPEALRARFAKALPDGDPFVSPHAAFGAHGWLVIAEPQPMPAAGPEGTNPPSAHPEGTHPASAGPFASAAGAAIHTPFRNRQP